MEGPGFSVAAVGDVNGDGFNDFVVGAPTITRSGTGPVVGTGSGAQAFLIFGSRDSASQIQDFLNLTPQQRIGDPVSAWLHRPK